MHLTWSLGYSAIRSMELGQHTMLVASVRGHWIEFTEVKIIGLLHFGNWTFFYSSRQRSSTADWMLNIHGVSLVLYVVREVIAYISRSQRVFGVVRQVTVQIIFLSSHNQCRFHTRLLRLFEIQAYTYPGIHYRLSSCPESMMPRHKPQITLFSSRGSSIFLDGLISI